MDHRVARSRVDSIVVNGIVMEKVCVLLCFIEPIVGGLGTNSGGPRGLLIKGLLTWEFRPNHTLQVAPQQRCWLYWHRGIGM
jgi:hypothetical protein